MKHPKCNNCSTSMLSIYYRKASARITVGYICPFCNGFYIFKGPNCEGPIPKNIGPLFIGLKKIDRETEDFK